MEKNFTVFDLLALDLPNVASLRLRSLTSDEDLTRVIKEPEINRPGLALCGFFENFGENRIQLFGKGEFAYLNKLEDEQEHHLLTDFFKYPMSCCVFAHNREPNAIFLRHSKEAGVPVLITALSSADFQIRLFYILSSIFAKTDVLHAVFVEVYGVGVLIRGESGVGKSEAALELIERGHKLIADDAVQVRKLSGNYLSGSPKDGIDIHKRHLLELRGVGFIDIEDLFGLRSVRSRKRVDMVVHLESWQEGRHYERIGVSDQLCSLLGVDLPEVVVPVKPGRNIPIIIEAAVLKHQGERNRKVTPSGWGAWF